MELNKQKGKFEVIIVDDASTDNTFEMIENNYVKLKYKIKYIGLKKQVGLPSARNIGIDNCSAEYIGFLDDDCFPIRDDFFLHILKWFSLKNFKIIGVGGPIFTKSKNPDFRWKKPSFVKTLRGGNCFFIKEFVKLCNGFDTRFDGNFFREDTDICMSLSKYGNFVKDPKISVNHLHINFGGCRVELEGFYSYFIANTVLLVVKHKKVPYELFQDTLFHFINLIKIIIKGRDNTSFLINRFKFLRIIIQSFILGFRKYNPNKRINNAVISKIIDL